MNHASTAFDINVTATAATHAADHSGFISDSRALPALAGHRASTSVMSSISVPTTDSTDSDASVDSDTRAAPANRSVAAHNPSNGPVDWAELATIADRLEASTLLRARIRLRQAQAAATTQGGREAAADAARQARVLATALGAAPMLARIDELARSARLLSVVPSEHAHAATSTTAGNAAGNAAGATASASPSIPALTARETDVLRLVAEGLSNGQIGARLYITTKTVSVHVSNILAKLGVSSRTEAAAVAHRERLLGDAA